VIPGKIPGPYRLSSRALELQPGDRPRRYLGTPNVVLMIPMVGSGHLERLTNCKRVLCAISVRAPPRRPTSSVFSKKHPNIVGAMIDDFYPVEEKLTVEQVKALSTALKSENPAFGSLRGPLSPIPRIESCCRICPTSM